MVRNARTVTLRELLTPARARVVVAAAALSVGGSVASLVVPWLVGESVESLTLDAPLHAALAGIVGLLALRLAFEFASTALAGIERARFTARSRATWFAKMLRVPPGHDSDERRQAWVSLLSYDIPRIATIAVSLPVSLTQAAVTLVGALVLMAQIDLALTAMVFVLAPLGYAVARLAVGRVRHLATSYWDLEIEAASQAEAGLGARWAILAFGQQARVERDFRALTEQTRAASVRHLSLDALIGPAVQFITFVGMVLIVLVGASPVGVELSPGKMLSFVLYGLLLSAPLRAIATSWAAWHDVDASLQRFAEVVNAPTAAPAGDVDTAPFNEALTLRDLHFSWGEHAVLRGATLSIAPGEVVALRGENGGGKSTLIALMLGFVAPTAGTIELDGRDITRLTESARRSIFAVAPQHGTLVPGSILDNVRFARPDATLDEVHAALRRSIADFVFELPDGIDTRVGEGGLKLSGGERQRVAVARALLTAAPILVLDEATSAYDTASRAAFLAGVRALEHQAVLWISHEPYIWDEADRVVELADGVVVSVS